MMQAGVGRGKAQTVWSKGMSNPGGRVNDGELCESYALHLRGSLGFSLCLCYGLGKPTCCFFLLLEGLLCLPPHLRILRLLQLLLQLLPLPLLLLRRVLPPFLLLSCRSENGKTMFGRQSSHAQ